MSKLSLNDVEKLIRNRRLLWVVVAIIAFMTLVFLYKETRQNILQPIVSVVPSGIKEKIPSGIKEKIKSVLGVDSAESNDYELVVSVESNPFNIKRTDTIYVFNNYPYEVTIEFISNESVSACYALNINEVNTSIKVSALENCNLGVIPTEVLIKTEGFEDRRFFIAAQEPSYIYDYIYDTANSPIKTGVDSLSSDTLLVMPITNIFAYDSVHGRYSSSKGLVHFNTSTIKIKKTDSWLRRQINSAISVSDFFNLDLAHIVYDVHLENINISKYNKIVLLLHTEYATKNILKKLSTFVSEGGDVITLGGAPLNREVVRFDENNIVLGDRHLNYEDYGFLSFDRDLYKVTGAGKDCRYSNDTFSVGNKSIPNVGEIVKLVKNMNVQTQASRSFIYCDDVKVPNVLVQNFGGGSIISITSDGLSEYLNYLNDEDSRLLR